MIETIQSGLDFGWKNFVNFVKWLNEPTTVRPVVEVGVWSATIFFTLFFIIMVVLKPRNPVDLGWTWLVGACSLVMIRVVTLTYTQIELEPIVTLFIWLNITAAVVYTTVVYVNFKWRKWRTWRAVKSGHERRSGLDRRKGTTNAG